MEHRSRVRTWRQYTPAIPMQRARSCAPIYHLMLLASLTDRSLQARGGASRSDATRPPPHSLNSVSMLLPMTGGARKRPAWATAAACPHSTHTKGHMVSDNSTPTPSLESEGATNYTPKSYDIAPEDAKLADSLVNQHPVYDLSGNASVVGSIKLPSEFTREMFPTDVRAQVDARLSEVPVKDRTPQTEQAIMRQEAERYAHAVRVWAGPGEDANGYQQELHSVQYDIWEAQTRLVEREAALSEIIRHDRKEDPATGELYDEPVYRIRGDMRTATEHEVAEYRHRIALLEGSEGRRRLAKAKYEAVEHAKKVRDEGAIDAEARQLAKADARAARVADRASAYRKFEETER